MSQWTFFCFDAASGTLYEGLCTYYCWWRNNFGIKAPLWHTLHFFIVGSDMLLNNTHIMHCCVSTATMVVQMHYNVAMKSLMGSRGAALLWDSLDPSWPWGVSRRDLQKRLGRRLVNQRGAQWRGHGDTRRQAREFISGPSLGTRAKFMTLSRIQSRAVTGLLTGHNTLRRHTY